MRKQLFVSFIICLSVLASCKGGGAGEDNPVTPPEEPRPTLMGLFNAQIEKQKEGTPRDKVFIVAHRANTYYGFQHNIPDNSIPGIESAIKFGADMVELDIRPTKDNVLVLMHNSTIDDSTTGTGNLIDYTYEELMKFDMKKGSKAYVGEDGKTVKVPTLKEALLACKDRIYINLDVKDASAAKLVRIIKECGMEGQVMIYTGSDVSFATECQYKDSGIAVHPYISSASDISKYTGLPGALLFQYGYDLYTGKNPEIGRQIRALGFLSYSNLLTFDQQILSGNYRMLDAFIDSETDFIQTDFVEFVDAYLGQKGLR